LTDLITLTNITRITTTTLTTCLPNPRQSEVYKQCSNEIEENGKVHEVLKMKNESVRHKTKRLETHKEYKRQRKEKRQTGDKMKERQ